VNALAERWRQADRGTVDLLIALGMAALTVAAVLGSTEREGPLAANLILALPIPLALLVRRNHPLVSVAVAVACASLLTLLLTPSFRFGPATISLIIAIFSVALHADRREALVGGALGVGSILGTSIAVTPDDILFPVLVFGAAPWALGRVLRGQTQMARELAEKEAMLRHVHELERQRAIAEERARVARELHDVLAHNLSVMVIQASGARRLLAANPDAAVEAARLIETTGREALVELRHVFGPIHHGEGESLEGTPGIAQLEGLIRRARAAGLPVELEVHGDPIELPAGAEMAAYRLVQEALTNTLKHAGAATTTVRLAFRPDGVTVAIEDAGDATSAPETVTDSGGHGLLGMRERFGLYGGEVEAGPRPGGGFAVRGRLPLASERVPA
jgi:signal transduction histidine kinase